MLWVEQGRALWERPEGAAGKSCASCHGAPASLAGVAARQPVHDARLGRLVNLEGRIRQCREQRQQAAPLPHESRELLALTTLVAHQSRGLPIAVSIDGQARPHFEAGRALYLLRQGQLNLACSNCHDDNWSKRLRAEPISQGHPTGYPIYRLEWQGVGSLHRRLRACLLGVRAEPFEPGAPELVDLELYLAWRAQGLAIETPAVRR
jgi:sulfur-oxidizing protein SoxA